GSWSFHFSLHPGLAAFALAAAAGRAWRLPGALGRVGRRGWALVAAGLFFALGAFNPLVSALLALPGLDAARFPVKLWLWVAMGLALVAGVGLERLLGDDARDARRRALATLGGFAALFALLALLCTFASGTAARALQAMMPPGVPLDFAAAEAARWAGLATLSAAAALLLAAAVQLTGRRPALGGALLVFVAAALQLVLLRPLLATEPTAIYRQPPPVLAALPADARIAHGAAGGLFGPDPPDEGLPAPEVRWVFRRTHGEAYPHAGALFGRRYDLHATPEGLDTAALQQAIDAVRGAPDDRSRVRLLRAWGIDHLVLGRQLDDGSADLVWQQPSYGRPLRVYRLPDAAPEVHLATQRVHLRPGAPPEAAVATMLDPRFVPGTAVVFESPERPPPPGRVLQLDWRLDGEGLAARTRTDGSTVLVWQRAWLPHYRASVDGEPAEVQRVDLYRLGIEVPPGEHQVAIWVDRGPTRWAWVGALLGALAVLALARAGRRRGDPAT
ncbi:MAG TPA: hypothetical protein VKU40_02960, partial [Thermoanaerobaculia bacterium]|nr:hypothetical protein [Thermoanaerobaculia bacterium]